MNVNDFEFIAQLLYQRSGLVITQEKAYLLESRLNPVARKWDLDGIDQLIACSHPVLKPPTAPRGVKGTYSKNGRNWT